MSATPDPIPKAGAAAAPDDDGALIQSARTGDHGAMSALLGRHGPVVRQRLNKRIGPHFRGVLDEDDVMQVTYLEAFLRMSAFTARAGAPGLSFVAWLTQIAENNLTDAIRGLERAKRPDPRRRVRSAPVQDSYASLIEVLGVESVTPSREAAMNEAVRAVEEAIKRLPPDYQKVVRLYDLDFRRVEEVAAEMGRSAGAIFMLRARAHDRLKEIMGAASKFFSR